MKKFTAITTIWLFTGFLLLFLILIITGGVVKADNSPNINYIDASGNTVSRPAASTSSWNANTTEGWYVVDQNIDIADRIEVTGDVHLILKDGTHLSASKGIHVGPSASLSIYAQSSSKTVGSLTATGMEKNAGIGGNGNENGGTITINGGTINAKGGKYSAGIGGGYFGAGGNIIISGGTVNATGGYYGAGIGVGANSTGGSVTITGGIVNATGGQSAAGIGGGLDGSGGSITITSGTVNATGGVSGAGIGGGERYKDGSITITDGTVNATGGGFGAGIGSGYYGDGGTITISGGTVNATSGDYGAGIGGGSNSTGGTITITGGTVSATSGNDGAGIGDGYNGNGGSFYTSTPDTPIGNAVIFATGGQDGPNISDTSGSASWSGVIFQGNAGYVYGSPTPKEDFTIQNSKTLIIDTEHGSSSSKGVLTIQNGRKMTISSGANLGTANDGAGHLGTLVNNGTIENSGTFINFGSLSGSGLSGSMVTINDKLPSSTTVVEPSSAVFTTSLTNENNLSASYAWQLSSSATGGWSSSGITNGQSSSYTISATDTSMNGSQYRCGVNVAGVQGYTNAATLTVNQKTYGITLNPSSSYAFPAAIIGYTQPASQTVTVSNTGNQPTGDLNIALSGSGSSSFTLSRSSMSSLAVNGSSSFTIQPKVGLTAGEHSATVTVSSGNDVSVLLVVNFMVKSYGITLSPSSSVTFDPVFEGYTQPEAKTVTVNNTGNQPTGDLSIALSGSGSSSFKLSDTSMSSLVTTGSSASFTVQPKIGLAAGEYSAAVTVSGRSGSSIHQTLPVSFTVQNIPPTPITTYSITTQAASASTGTVTANPTTVVAGGSAVITAIPAEGFVLEYWEVNGTILNSKDNPLTISNVQQNTTVTAHFSAAQTVTFDSMGGSPVDMQVVASGAVITVPKDPTRDGYAFKGWYADKDYTTPYDFSTPVTTDLTLYAKWIINKPSASPVITYNTYVENLEWTGDKTDGDISGTSGQALRMEAVKATVSGVEGLGVSYSVHVQNKGWLDAVADGETAGTEHQGLRLEAINIELTGEQAANYDIYYRVHAQNIGWMSWAKNGENAGTQGLAMRLEAVQMMIVEKGADAPEQNPKADTTKAFIQGYNLYAKAHGRNYGWSQVQKANQIYPTMTVGTTGQGLRMEAIQLSDDSADTQLTCKVHVQNKGWLDAVVEGQTAGTTGQALRVEAIEIDGSTPDGVSVQYRAHIAGIGWQDWKNLGEVAGTTGQARAIEAIEFRVVSE